MWEECASLVNLNFSENPTPMEHAPGVLIECDSDKLIAKCIYVEVDRARSEGGNGGKRLSGGIERRDEDKPCSLKILFTRLSHKSGLFSMAV